MPISVRIFCPLSVCRDSVRCPDSDVTISSVINQSNQACNIFLTSQPAAELDALKAKTGLVGWGPSITYASNDILQASVFLTLVRESLKIPKPDTVTERVLRKKYPERSIGASTYVSFFFRMSCSVV